MIHIVCIFSFFHNFVFINYTAQTRISQASSASNDLNLVCMHTFKYSSDDLRKKNALLTRNMLIHSVSYELVKISFLNG